MFQDKSLSNTEIPIPPPKVQILRRKSIQEKIYNSDFLKDLLNNFRKRSSIPRVELAYQSFPNNDSHKGQEALGMRPSTSPMSVILKSDQPEVHTRRFQKGKNRELPLIIKKKNEFSRDFSVSGNSVSYCDWVGVLLNSSKLPVSNVLDVKISNCKKPRNVSIQKMNRRLKKGRCSLLFNKLSKEKVQDY